MNFEIDTFDNNTKFQSGFLLIKISMDKYCIPPMRFDFRETMVLEKYPPQRLA